MPRIYTRTGDSGETGLPGGRRVRKDDPRIEACGALDEANSALGLLAVHLEADLAEPVAAIQRALFAVGGRLAAGERGPSPETSPGEPPRGVLPGPAEIEALERLIDGWEEDLPPLRAFVIPGGSPPAAVCHLARSMVRRAERRVVALARGERVDPAILAYLNRLSDCLFVLARLINLRRGVEETYWQPITPAHHEED